MKPSRFTVGAEKTSSVVCVSIPSFATVRHSSPLRGLTRITVLSVATRFLLSTTVRSACTSHSATNVVRTPDPRLFAGRAPRGHPEPRTYVQR
jgi:hypothetical protein